MRKLTPLILLLTLSFASIKVNAQETVKDSVTTNKAEHSKISIIPMPVIAANPTTGMIFGVAPGVSWFNGDPKNTSMTNFLATFLYTSNKQLFIQMRGSVFFSEDKWISTTDLRYNLNSQPTYGLSTKKQSANNTEIGFENKVSDDLFDGPPLSEMMEFDHFRFYQTVLKRHEQSRFFYGLGYHLDIMSNIDDHQLDLSSSEQVITNHYNYQTIKNLPLEGYTQSGISLNLLYDSRDNVANPYKGRYAFASYRINPEFLGSTANSNSLWLEYRDYVSLDKSRPRNLIAFWAFGNFVTGGKVPYMFLPAVGWDMFGRSARPYTQGRFRGEDLVYAETEWRFPLQKEKDKFGGVVFMNATSASSRTQNINVLNYYDMGYGLGLRYMISAKNRINICLDYGFGENGASGVFLNLNEMF